MDEKPHHKESEPVPKIGRNAQIMVLASFSLIAVAAISLTLWSIVSSTKDTKPGLQNGVGADGFQAFVEEKSNLGIELVVSKKQVVTALGRHAKSVYDGVKEKPFNLNGNRGQTITFYFVREDGVKSSLYVDKRMYKTAQALNDDRVYDATLKGGTAGGHPLYYRAAQTIGTDREYHLMVVNGTTVYRFVIAQPFTNITITEVPALAVLKKLAQEASL